MGALGLRSRLRYRSFSVKFYVYNPIIRTLYQFASEAHYRTWVTPPTGSDAAAAEYDVDSLCEATHTLRGGFVDLSSGDASAMLFIVTPVRGARLCLRASTHGDFARWTMAVANASTGAQEIIEERAAHEAAASAAFAKVSARLEEIDMDAARAHSKEASLEGDLAALQTELQDERERASVACAALKTQMRELEALRSAMDQLRLKNAALVKKVESNHSETHLSDFFHEPLLLVDAGDDDEAAGASGKASKTVG